MGSSGTTVTIENCTLYGASADNLIANGGASPTNVTIRNVISVASGEDFDLNGNVVFFGNNMYEDAFDPNAYDGSNQAAPATRPS